MQRGGKKEVNERGEGRGGGGEAKGARRGGKVSELQGNGSKTEARERWRKEEKRGGKSGVNEERRDGVIKRGREREGHEEEEEEWKGERKRKRMNVWEREGEKRKERGRKRNRRNVKR